MIIYCHNSPDKPPASVPFHVVTIAPAAHFPGRESYPTEWLDRTDPKNPKPAQIHVEFHYGEAEVDDSVAKYMLDLGLAQKTRYIAPNAWNSR